MAVSTAHTASALQALGYDYPMIPGSPQGSSINSTYSISAYPTVILIAPNRAIVEKDIWPIDNTILRTKITNAGGITQACPSTDIENPEMLGFDVFPNPFNDDLNIIIDKKAEIEIFDLSGRLIENFIVSSNTLYNCSHLQSGMYIIRAVDEEGHKISMRKIIKN